MMVPRIHHTLWKLEHSSHQMSVVVNVPFHTWWGECLVWWLFGVVNGLLNTWCGECVAKWMSYFIHGVVNVWCSACPITHMVWWMLPDHDDDDGDDYDVQKCRAGCKTAMKNSANQWRCYCRNISLWTLTIFHLKLSVGVINQHLIPSSFCIMGVVTCISRDILNVECCKYVWYNEGFSFVGNMLAIYC